MKKLLTVALALVLAGTFASSVFGAEKMSQESKLMLYSAEKKDPWIAVGAAWLLPSLGHAYAGDWNRGLPFIAGYVGGYALMVSGASSGNSSTTSLGLIIFVGSRIWEYVDAYGTAEEYNSKLKKSYGISLQLRNDLPVLAYTASF